MNVENLLVFIKYFGIIICSLYMTLRLLNIRIISKYKVCLSILFVIIVSITVCLLKRFTVGLDILNISFITIYSIFLSKRKSSIIGIATVISYAISYVFYIISIIIVGALFLIFGSHNLDLTLSIFALIVQIFLSILPFMFKRLKNGYSFLQNEEISSVGLLISGIIVILITFIRTDFSNNRNYMFFIIGTVICIFGIIFWWRNRLTKLYLERNTKRKVEELNKIIVGKDALITELKTENERLSSLIHRDNKVIPAMGMAVRKYINQPDQRFSDDTDQEGEDIISQLDFLMKDRYEAITKAKNLSKVLPDVNVDSINGIFQYMYLRAAQHNIDYDVIVRCSIKYLTENIISELELSTILSDLIDNSIIATIPNDYKKIIVTIAVNNNLYEIDIQDSGVLFDIEILMKMGHERVTSHLDSGGSGIGLKTLFEVLKKRKASFVLTEYPQKQNSFTKSINIRFDNRDEFMIHSFRADELKESINREDLLILPVNE